MAEPQPRGLERDHSIMEVLAYMASWNAMIYIGGIGRLGMVM
jgi:hypothetical protein